MLLFVSWSALLEVAAACAVISAVAAALQDARLRVRLLGCAFGVPLLILAAVLLVAAFAGIRSILGLLL